MSNLRSLDLNLMTVFEAVFETGSITRAAQRLGLSQSATSHAMSRLRDACNDDLFVRVGQGITPTTVAQRIYPEVRRSLEGLRRALTEARGFDPSTSTRRFQIAIPHPMGPLWAQALRQAAAIVAPNVMFGFDTQTIPREPDERLRKGDLDLSLDWVPASGERFVNRKIFDDSIVFLARRGHPRAKPNMGLDELQREQFARAYRRDGTPSEAVRIAAQAMEELGLDWALQVSEYLEVPFIIMQTDLLGFVPGTMVKAAADTGLLQVIETPLPPFPIPIFLIWHETRRSDDGHRWLRELVTASVIALAQS